MQGHILNQVCFILIFISYGVNVDIFHIGFYYVFLLIDYNLSNLDDFNYYYPIQKL